MKQTQEIADGFLKQMADYIGLDKSVLDGTRYTDQVYMNFAKNVFGSLEDEQNERVVPDTIDHTHDCSSK